MQDVFTLKSEFLRYRDLVGSGYSNMHHTDYLKPDTPRGRGVARWDPAHVSSRVKLCMHAKFQVCRSKGLSGHKQLFFLLFSFCV